MFVNQLYMAVSAQQNAEVIKPVDYSLQLYTIHEKNYDGYFVFTDMVQEYILQVLFFVSHLLQLYF